MKIIDLSHCIKENMPVYPGTEKPVLKEANTILKDGFRETLLRMYSHTGTHLDCPAHLFQDGLTTETMPIEAFAGKASVLDVREMKEGMIGLDIVKQFLLEHGTLEFLILFTGWEERWGKEDYFKDYPVLTQAAIEFLAKQKIKGIGMDTMSIDPMNDQYLPSHRIILKNKCIIIENLCNLEALANKEFTFCAFPLKFTKGDGSPVRAVALM